MARSRKPSRFRAPSLKCDRVYPGLHLRPALAADLLCEPEATIGTVAAKVGYSSPFALSTAFKRVRGTSPQEHRASARNRVDRISAE